MRQRDIIQTLDSRAHLHQLSTFYQRLDSSNKQTRLIEEMAAITRSSFSGRGQRSRPRGHNQGAQRPSSGQLHPVIVVIVITAARFTSASCSVSAALALSLWRRLRRCHLQDGVENKSQAFPRAPITHAFILCSS